MLLYWFYLSKNKLFLYEQCALFLSRADAVYEDMKQRYGSQGCYLLKMNTRSFSAEGDEQIPDPWSQYLQRNILHTQVRTAASSTCINWPWSSIITFSYSKLQLENKITAQTRFTALGLCASIYQPRCCSWAGLELIYLSYTVSYVMLNNE